MTKKTLDLATYLGLYPKGLARIFPKLKTQHAVLVTPQKAAAWMKKLFKGQRQVSATHVRAIAQKMLAGTFIDTGQDVAFDWFDRLIDGQHRLLAVIESGVSVYMTVSWGYDPLVYLHRDEDGKTRGMGTYLSKDFRHPDRAISAYRILLDYEHLESRTSMLGKGHLAFGRRSVGGMKANREKALSWCIERKEALQHLLAVVHAPEAKAILPPPALSSGFYLWVYLQWPDQADHFFTKLIDGSGLRANDPIFQTRKSLERLKEKGRRKMGTAVPYYEWGAILLKGWNSFVEGGTADRISFSASEAWPRLAQPQTHTRKAK